MKILHLINDFTTGGAQNALLKLIREDKKSNCNIHTVIIVVNRTDEIFIKLKDNDIQYFFLYDKLDLLSSYRIFKFIITEKPNVIQSWLYISDLLSLLFKLVYPKLKLIWNIRNGQPAKGIISRYSWIAARICSKCSFIPSKIICPSKASIEYHVDFGYRKSKFVYIPNFIDPVYSEGLISKGIENSKREVIIFGVVTRFDDQKGIDTLLNAIYQLPPGLNIKFHFIGTGMTKDNVESKLQLLQIPSISYELCCLEKQKNLFEFYENIDFHISPSRSEAFPNAVFESMFMGKPNIATNAGDSSIFISDIGFLVDVNDHDALAKAIIKFVKIYNENFKEYLNLSRRSHEWINTSFDMTEVLEAYNEVWKN
jgi:glycosyltransferase involved in cell wall biosynthesis